MFRSRAGNTAGYFVMLALVAAALMGLRGADGVDVDVQIQREIKKGYKALDYWDYGLAEEIGGKLRGLIDSSPEKDDYRELDWLRYQAHLCFHLGNYEEALGYADRAQGIKSAGTQSWDEFYDRVKSMARLWKDAVEEKSDHFIIRYLPGPEKVLVEPGLFTLEKSHEVLTRELGVVPDRGPVLVEVYPSVKALSSAVALSEDDLKNSGTIAICRYGRIMITTPRQLHRGYDYLTTLSHEFVHYLIYLRNGPRCPLWLQEGMAKYEEDRWKGEPGGRLDPVAQSLLASALRSDEFISFDEMYPTFAKFDSPVKGQLAFAEVATVVEYLAKDKGMERVFDLLDMLKAGVEDMEALARFTGKDFEGFWEDWKMYVASKNFEEIPGLEVPKLEFRDIDLEDIFEQEDTVGENDYAEGEAWKYVRLGDLLRNRNHFAAAVMEYEKALAYMPYQPRIQNKLAFNLILMGRYREALKPLAQAEKIYPTYVTTYVNTGRAYAGLGDTANAIRYFEKALTINPFDPEPHRHLIKLYEKAGRQKMKEKAQERLDMISMR